MRRVDGLYDISRRTFCAIAGAGGFGLVIGSCTDGSTGTVQTGGLGTGPDAAVKPPIDAPKGSGADAPTGVACSGSPTDVGPATTFTLNNPVYFSSGNFFVVRDSGGLYALTAACTHEGATTCIGTQNGCSSSGTVFFCPRHGATFTFDGAVISGPVFVPLAHYGMCDLANGHLGVMTSTMVAASARLAG